MVPAESQGPEYLKINPRGVVPTLVHDGKVVRESNVILEYLEDAFPAHPLRPEDPFERAEMRLCPAGGHFLFRQRNTPSQGSPGCSRGSRAVVVLDARERHERTN